MKKETIEQEIQTSLKNEITDIRESVRQITLKALTDGELNMSALKSVMDAVVKGTQNGAIKRRGQESQALSEAIYGLDEALAVAAEATKQALQEAYGRTGEFSRQELSHAMDDLKGLESLFIETLSDSARNSTDFVKITIRDLTEEAKSKGTLVGRQASEAVTQLGDTIVDTAKTELETSAQTLRTGGAMLTSIASGMLAGVAERLHPTYGNKPGSPAENDNK